MPQRTQSDRISALEEGYRNIGREVGGLREDFATFARDMRNESTSRNRTQWSPLISAAALVVAILGGLITLGAQGPLRDLDRHSQELVDVRRTVAAQSDEDFDRSEAETMLDDLLERIDRRDASIRREVAAEVRGLRALLGAYDAHARAAAEPRK